MTVLELRGVRRTYRRGPETVEALRGVDLTVEPGIITALVGPSGCGKTTLLNIAGGVDHPDAGEVWLEGRRVDALPERERTRLRRTRIGMVFQEFLLAPHLTALGNVRLPLLFSGDDRRDAGRFLERCEVGHRRDFYPHQLSGGEQQRVAIARALVHSPSLLLADEPTGALDHEQAARLWELFESLAAERKMAVLIATHDASMAERAGRVRRLLDGSLTG